MALSRLPQELNYLLLESAADIDPPSLFALARTTPALHAAFAKWELKLVHRAVKAGTGPWYDSCVILTKEDCRRRLASGQFPGFPADDSQGLEENIIFLRNAWITHKEISALSNFMESSFQHDLNPALYPYPPAHSVPPLPEFWMKATYKYAISGFYGSAIARASYSNPSAKDIEDAFLQTFRREMQEVRHRTVREVEDNIFTAAFGEFTREALRGKNWRLAAAVMGARDEKMREAVRGIGELGGCHCWLWHEARRQWATTRKQLLPKAVRGWAAAPANSRMVFGRGTVNTL